MRSQRIECRFARLVWLASLLSPLLLPAARAQAVTDASFSEQVMGLPSSVVAGTLSNTLCNGNATIGIVCSNGTATASGVIASVNGTTSANSVVGAPGVTANAGVIYYFEVVGPSSILVPLLISGSVSTTTSASTDFAAQANATMGIGGGPSISACSSSGTGANPCGSTPESASLTSVSFTESANSIVQVGLAAFGITSGGPPAGSASFSAMADPTISIDPTFLASNPGFSLVFSPSISPVPEPSTLALMVAGLGLAFVARLRASNSLRSSS
jgi:hypothetical protein